MRLIDADELIKSYLDHSRTEFEIKNCCMASENVIAIIDNAPTVERPQGECENCDFRKFTETFVDGVVEVMNKNGITSVEQLSEILKGGAEW
jgi:hypothetical protein